MNTNELLRKVILKYTNVVVESNEQNLLDLPILEEVWLYIILELEERYHLPMLKVVEMINAEEYNLYIICKNLELTREQINADSPT